MDTVPKRSLRKQRFKEPIFLNFFFFLENIGNKCISKINFYDTAIHFIDTVNHFKATAIHFKTTVNHFEAPAIHFNTTVNYFEAFTIHIGLKCMNNSGDEQYKFRQNYNLASE